MNTYEDKYNKYKKKYYELKNEMKGGSDDKLLLEKKLYNKLYKWWLKLSNGSIIILYSDKKFKLVKGTKSTISKEWDKYKNNKDIIAIIWSSISIDTLTSFIKLLIKKNTIQKISKLTTKNIVKYILNNYKSYFIKMKIKSDKDYTFMHK